MNSTSDQETIPEDQVALMGAKQLRQLGLQPHALVAAK
jgi:hypothetical protein